MTKKPKAEIEPQKPELPEPDKREKEAIQKATQDLLKRKPELYAKIEFLKESNNTNISAPHSNTTGWYARVLAAFGTSSANFLNETIGNLNKAITTDINKPLSEQAYNSALAVLDSMQPQNELETMLITQMIATHNLAMQQLGLLKRTDHA